ncbi:DBC1/CARP1 catalytically inactive NUDIX hydrolase domain-containing protein, partial [Baffinella frigidus]
MLLQGLPDKWWEATDAKSVAHLSKAVKFLCAKTAQTGLFALGGAWDPALDGGGREPDKTALTNTAIRCVNEAIGIDLSGVKTWHSFMELRYRRAVKGKVGEIKEERTLFLVPQVADQMPDQVQYKANVAEIQDH